MLFDSDDIRNERIIYQTKPNMLFGCKKAIFGIVLLILVLMISPRVIQFIGEMQVYLISRIDLPLTRYAAIAFFVIILCIVVYIIWQLVGWYSKEYTLTESRIIIKSGVLSTKKNYMPYARVQDINTSQSFIAKMFGIGSIYLFSAYDNNQLELTNIHNPSKVEDIIFSHMVNSRVYSEPQPRFPRNDSYFERNFQSSDDYLGANDYYDEFEPITPIGHEKDNRRREYEYYPEDLGYNDERYNRYEYEPYDDRAIRFEGTPNSYQNDGHYNQVVDEYSDSGREYHQNNNPEIHYNENVGNVAQDQSTDMDESSEKVIQRHFDKFKR